MSNKTPLPPRPAPRTGKTPAPQQETKAAGSKAGLSAFLSYIFVPRKRQPNFLFGVAMTTLKLAFILMLIVAISGAGVVIGVAKAYAETIPDLDTGKLTDQNLSSFIYDRNGKLLTTYRGTENRILTSYEDMPENLIYAFVAVEDARFYTHNGVDIKRIAGAFVNNMRNDSVQGGSTITQQLIKLQLLSTEQTYKRKIQEAYMALEIEKLYTKEQILELYLNTIWLGESNYGVVAAANDYFGKDLKDLTLRECATLAGITRNPTRYNPRRCIYTTDTPEISVDRTNYVLAAMYENNYITRSEYDAALGQMPSIKQRFADKEISEETYRSLLKSNMRVLEKATVTSLYDMPSAVETVLADVEDAFMRARGLEINKENRAAIRKEIQSGGYHIYSTIDPEIQKIAEDVVYNWDQYPPMKNEADSVKRTISSAGIVQDTIQPQVALSIFDYKSGEIVAVIGSRTPPTGLLEYNRASSSVMPVGSSIKPISVYGPALDMGNSPASVTINMPIPIAGWGTEKGYPSNSTRGDFKGVITFRRALSNSLNTAAANTLMDYVGINDSKNYLISLGIDPNHILADGFGLSLGSSGITPIEMSVAFGTIANTGTYQQPLTFTRVTDSLGNVVLDMKAEQRENTRQVYRKGTSWMLTDMLIEAVQRGICYNAKIDGMTIGGKTGTHSDYIGVSFSGFSPYYSCTVWIGADESKALGDSATGNKYAAPLWQTVMARVHEELGLEDKNIIEETPEALGLVQATTCSLTGLLATDACKADTNFAPVTDWWHSDSVPHESCGAHVLVNYCADSSEIADIYCANTVQRTIALLPQGHRAEQLTAEQRKSLMPGVIVGVPEEFLANTAYGGIESALAAMQVDARFLEYFCPIHLAPIETTADPEESLPFIADPWSVG